MVRKMVFFTPVQCQVFIEKTTEIYKSILQKHGNFFLFIFFAYCHVTFKLANNNYIFNNYILFVTVECFIILLFFNTNFTLVAQAA